MKSERMAKIGRVASLILGIAFCCLLFSYGVTQNVPIGELEGTVTLAENGKALPNADVYLTVKDDDEARERIDTTDAKGHFHFHNVRVGDYTINIEAQEHHSNVHAVTVTEGKPTEQNFALKPNPPYLKMYASQRVWMPTEAPQVELHGFRTGDSLNVEVLRVNFPHLLQDGRFNWMVSSLRDSTGVKIPKGYEKYSSPVVAFQHRVKHKDVEGAFVEPLDLPDLQRGFYWVRCKGTGFSVATYVNVSDIALVTKTAKGRVLGYVTDLTTGKPVPQATLWTETEKATVNRVQTDKDGLAEASYAAPSDGEDSQAAMMATRGPSTALVGVYTSADSDNSGASSYVIYTDRPVYRPGDDVQFKGIVREKSGEQYLPPKSGTVDIELHDTDDQPFQKFTLPVSAHGSFNGHFSTSSEAGPGLYRIVAKGFGGRGSHFVHMMAYRKPEYNIQITPQKPYYVFGDKAAATIQCSYYYGGPVPGAKLDIRIFASPIWQQDPESDDNSEDNPQPYSGGDFSKDMQVTTDEAGKAVITFDTKTDSTQHTPHTDLQYSIDVSMTDASKKYTEANGSVLVTRGLISLSAQCQSFMAAPGTNVDVLVRTASNDTGHPPVANRPVTVTTYQEIWDADGKSSKKKTLDTYPVVTDSEGRAHALVKASVEGRISVSAVVKDDLGNQIESDDSFYVYGGRWNAAGDQSSIDVALDKRHYKVGDVATVMVTTVAPGGSALVTIQTDHVLWKRILPLPEKTALFKLPVDAAFAPNCFISVAYVHHKKFYENNTRLAVNAPMRSLKLTVESDKPKYHPGDNVHLNVHTLDAKGSPVPADVSVGVVDESIYAIRPDDFNVLEAFYPRKENSVVTSYSFSEVYLDGGDKGGDNVKIRRKFRDTAAWFPSVVTDANGFGTVDFTLPDNLTEWRATAIAITDGTSVAKATTKFKARKELMVRLEMPQYLVQQDTHELVTIVTNDGDTDRDVHFSLSATGVTVQGDTRQTIHLASGRQQALTFQLGTGDSGQAMVTAKAWTDGGPSDGVEQSFPVMPHGVPMRDAWSAEVTGSKDFNFNLGPTIDRTTGRVKIDVQGTLAGGLVNALDDLIGFPYGCVEQTMSRFMPSVLVAKTVRDLGLPNPKLEKQIPKIASDSMIRLAQMQHEDGGWGWWKNDSSDPFMTALVLDGLYRCKAAGYEIRKVDTDKALNWCSKRTLDKEWKDDDLKAQCYLVYVLARYEQTESAIKAYQSLILRKASDSDFAVLAMAMNALGPKYAATRDRFLDRLDADLHKGPLGAYWDNSDWEWGAEGTALGLTAFMEIRPNDPSVPLIVRYLMLHRKGDMWDSTRDTAYSLIGLTAYLAKTHELTGTSDVRVLVNGKVVRETHFDNTKADNIDSPLLIPLSELHSGGNTVRVETTGKGVCYATVELKGTEIQPKIAASSPVPGLRISRKYFKMETRRLENGDMQLLPSKHEVTSFESGDIIRVELTVFSNTPRRFILIEDPTPSNCRVTEREYLDDGEEWSFWWDNLVIRDDRVAYFMQYLPQGEQKITYSMRAEGSGVAHVLPSSLSNMYDLSTRASGAEGSAEVK